MPNYSRIPKTILLFLLIVSACESPIPNIDFDTLSEEEKRMPKNALASMDVVEDLELQLFASEPMITNPTNMAIDARGRVWVCEGRNYRLFANPDNPYDKKGDRILILEDTNGDGKADTSKVFYQGEDINSALGIAVLGNKIIVSVSPNVFVFTDKNGDDVPDSKELLFSGIEGVDHDHGVHAFVFGPDGRLYFNFGNNGAQLFDSKGNPVIDIHGKEINNSGNPFREGMAFRTQLDGSQVEVLGYNFRNPFELTVDSHGGLWQSDNDDDGNRATRINYLMEYGNYGFKDKLSGENWRQRRTGWHTEIPKRHWHLNDPGTVPNLLQTGSGSPCGILVYEDGLLPERFQNQLIHAAPGHNVVRSYKISNQGAGYTAQIENLVKSRDDWFRPSDVTVAPDGSLFITDWYDGGVGGHKAEDLARGRVYRLSTSGSYRPTTYNFSTGEGAMAGLLSDNMDVFYQSWQKLHAMGEGAEPYLKDLISKGGTAKARALWLATLIPSRANDYLQMALQDEAAKFRIQGIRMARYVAGKHLTDYLQQMVTDPSAQVRRELAIALKYQTGPKVADLWSNLALQHQAGDRWSLEALGIGADENPEELFEAWKTKIGPHWNGPAGLEIIWRIHSTASIPMLISAIKDPTISEEKLPSYFRALRFKDHPDKNHLLLELLDLEHPLSHKIQAYTVGQLDPSFVNSSKQNMQRVTQMLPKIEGTAEWLMAIKNLQLKNINDALFRVMVHGTEEDIQKESAQLLFKNAGSGLADSYLGSSALESDKMNVLKILGSVSDSTAVELLTKHLLDSNLSGPMNQRIVEVLGNSWRGQHKLKDLLEEGKVSESLKTTAVLKLMGSWSEELKKYAIGYLDQAGKGDLDVAVLLEKSGDAPHGKEVYKTYCSACHVAGNMGIEFGPGLSDIGNKLSRQFMYSSIIDPSAGINFGYEGYSITMKDGKTYTGYILSRTEDMLALKMMGGAQVELPLSDIKKQEALEKSLMTEGLHKVMSEGDLVDLVAFLETLKVEEVEPNK